MADITVKKDEIPTYKEPSLWGFVTDLDSWKDMGRNLVGVTAYGDGKTHAGNNIAGQAAVNSAATFGAIADGWVNMYRLTKSKITDEPFVPSDIADKSRKVHVSRLPSLTGQAAENVVAGTVGVVGMIGDGYADMGIAVFNGVTGKNVAYTNAQGALTDATKSAGRTIYGTPVAPRNENEKAMLTSLGVGVSMATIMVPTGTFAKVGTATKGAYTFVESSVSALAKTGNTAKVAARVEPVMPVVNASANTAKVAEAATPAAPGTLKSAAEAAGGTVKKRSSSFAEEQAINERLAAAAGKAEPAAAKATAEAAKDTAGAAAKAAKPAAEAADKVEKLSIFRAWWLESRFSMRNNDLTERLRQLHQGGHPDLAKSLLARERVAGFKASDVTDIRQAVKVGDLPKEMGAMVEKANGARIIGTGWRTPGEWGAAHANYIREAPVMGTLTAVKDLVAAPLQATVFAAKNLGTGLKIAGYTLLADGAIRTGVAAAGDAKHPIMEGARGAGNDATWAVAKTINGVGHMVSWLPGEWAAQKAKQIFAAAPGALIAGAEMVEQGTVGFGTGLGEGYNEQVNGVKPKETKKDGDEMVGIGTVLNAAKAAKFVKKEKEKLEGDADSDKDLGDTRSPAPPEGAANAPASKANSKPDAETADEDLSETELAKLSPKAREKIKQLKTAGAGVAEKAGDALDEAKMKNIGDMAMKGGWMGILGAIFGFMGGTDAKGKIGGAMGLGLLFGMLGKALGISPTADGAGIFGSSNRPYRNHRSALQDYPAADVRVGADGRMMHGARHRVVGETVENRIVSPADANRIKPVSGQVLIQPPADSGLITPPRVGAPVPQKSAITTREYGMEIGDPTQGPAINQGNGVTTHPVESSAAKAEADAAIARISASSKEQVKVDGIVRTYGEDPVVAMAPQVKRDKVPELVPSLG